jgi:hypothetical protein
MMRVVLLAAALCLAAIPAHAGPVAAIAGWIGSVIAAGGVAGTLMRIAIGIGASLLSTAITSAFAKKPKVEVNFEKDLGDDTPLTFVVGQYVTAGKSKYIGSWGKNTRYITEVIEISCLPVPGIDAIWVNDELGEVDWEDPHYFAGSSLPTPILDPASHLVGYPIKNFSEGVGSSDERDRAWIKLIDGTQTAADSFLMGIFFGDDDYPWTMNMVGAGKAYVVLTYYYDPESMTAVPSFLIQPTPLPMYDLRKDSTVGGSGAHRWDDPATWEPTKNPAVISYNIARGIYWGSEWIFGGKNLAAWRLPAAEWMAAANECDATVALEGGGSEPAYRCGAEISVDMMPADILEELGRAANMRFAEVGGRLKPIVGLPGASVLSITDENIVITEGQSFSPFQPLSSTYNALSATYPEPGEKWASKDAVEYIDEDATEADGGRYLPTSVSYGAAPFGKQVQRLMRSQMRDYRRMRRHQFHLPPEAYGLEPLVDMISWTSPRNGYDGKFFVVESVAKTPGMLVLVSLREADPSDYDWSIEFEQPLTIVTPVNPIPFTQAISGFAAEPLTVQDLDGDNRRAGIRVSCDGDEVGVTHIRLQARLNGSLINRVDVELPFDDPFEWDITDVLPDTTYQVRGLLLSDLTPYSDWADWLTVTTPDIRLGPKDMDYAEITSDVAADLAELNEWADATDDVIAGLVADVDGVSASGLLKISVEATPAGALSRIGLKAKASDTEDDSLRSAAMYLEAVSGDKSQVVFEADRFAIVNGGAREQPFVLEGGNLYLGGDVRIAGMLSAATMDPSFPLAFDLGAGRRAPLLIFRAAFGTGSAGGTNITVDMGTLYGPESTAVGSDQFRLARYSSKVIIEAIVDHAATGSGSTTISVSVDGAAYAPILSFGPGEFGVSRAFEYTTPSSFNTLQFRCSCTSAMKVISVSLKVTAINW